MDLVTISSLILIKAQPLLNILGLTGAIASVQLTVILAIALISIITIISTLSLMVYGWKKITQKEAKPNSEDKDVEDPDLQEESEELQARIQAEPGASGYKPEPKIIGKYYNSLETIIAIHAYRDVCLHIEKTILEPNTYSIKYKIEDNNLIAYLHSPNNITRINIDNMFLELNGRFDVVLKLLTKWNSDHKNIEVLLKHLSMLPGSIEASYASQWNASRWNIFEDKLDFFEYTARFWGHDLPCKLLNCFIWSKPSEAHGYLNIFSHNLTLLLIMPMALTQYSSIMKKGRYRSEKTLQRTEGDFCTYTVGDVIDSRIFKPFSQIHPADTPVSNRFNKNPNFLVLNNYIGGQLAHSPFPEEKEVVIQTDVLITVTEITENCTERRDKDNSNPPYRKIQMSAKPKPAIADEYLANPPEAILSNFFDKSVGKHFTNTNVLSTILEYTGLPSDASNNESGNRTKKPRQ